MHENGVIHGDLTPNNILVGTKGVLKVTDFGMATAAGGSEMLHGGTPEYRGHEVAHGLPRTPWTDLWSFGLILIQFVMRRRFWGLGLAVGVAAEARRRLSSEGRPSAELFKLLEVAASCFGHDAPSARAIGERLRDLFQSKFREELPAVPPHPSSPTPEAELRRRGTIAYDSPVLWWEDRRCVRSRFSAASPTGNRRSSTPVRGDLCGTCVGLVAATLRSEPHA